MAERRPTSAGPGPEGLAGGPGPTPPGFDDGTPRPLEEAGAVPAGGAPEAPRRAGEEAPGGVRTARGDPEEPDPS